MIESREAFEARIYTPTYRAYGFIHLAPEITNERLLNSLNRTLLPVTRPLIYTPGYEHPPEQSKLRVSAGFLAIHYGQIGWLAGGRPPDVHALGSLRRLAFLFDGYVLVGRVAVPEGVRSSDFLESASTFQTLFDAELFPWRATIGRFLLLGRDVDPLFEVGGVEGRDPGVVTLESRERFPFVTVNLSRVTGVLEAPQNEPAQVSGRHSN